MDLANILTLVLVIELLFLVIARIIGPNMFIGVRFGFIVINRRTWNKTHEFSIYVSLLSLLVFIAIASVVRNPALILMTFILILVASMIIIILRGLYYAEKITGFEPVLPKEIKPIQPVGSRKMIYALLISYLLSLITVLSLYNLLPQVIYTRFDIYGNPIDMQDKTVFALSMITLTTIIALIGASLYYVELKYPILFYSGALMRKWGRLGLYRVFMYGMIASEILMCLATITISLWNLGKVNVIGLDILIAIILSIGFSPIIIAYLQRNRRGEAVI